MATKKETKKNDTKLEQPTAPAAPAVDASISEEVKLGHEAWLTRRAAIEARAAASPDVRLPSIDYHVALRAIRDTLPKLTPHLPDALRRLAPDEQVATRAAAAEVLTTAQAARFVASQLDAQRAEGKTIARGDKKDRRDTLTALRDDAFAQISLGAALGHVPQATIAQLRAGNGLQDNAEDLERIGLILKELWPVLEPLQVHQRDPKKRLTLAQIEHMITFGGQLLAEIKREATQLPGLLGVSWRAQMIGASLLLDDQWSALTDALHYHARRAKNAELPTLLKPLRGMRG